jgi:hypothetical protein
VKRRKNLKITWINYTKAFDSVPQSWIEKSTELTGVNNNIFLNSANYQWRNGANNFS